MHVARHLSAMQGDDTHREESQDSDRQEREVGRGLRNSARRFPLLNRREFIDTLAGGLLAAPLAAEAQPSAKVPRIGYLAFN
jgi:hypothetical protein